MNALVVYDSVYGNTEKITRKIGESIGEDAKVVRVTEIDSSDLVDLDYLVVGSPTRGFLPTKKITSFLNTFTLEHIQGVTVAAFDTRMSIGDVNNAILTFMVKIFGYADKPIENKLVRKGGKKVVASEGFIVQGTKGPLKDGELERATEWAQNIINA
jgi:flavodoxin